MSAFQSIGQLALSIAATYTGQWWFFAASYGLSRYDQASKEFEAKRAARRAFNDAQRDRLEMVERDPNYARTLPLGRVRTVEALHRYWQTGVNREKLTQTVSFAGVEIDAFEQWYLDDIPVTLDVDGWVETTADGNASGYLTNTAGYARGATSINVTSGTGTFLAGDAFKVEGDSTLYTVASNLTGPGALSIASPGLLRAIPAVARKVELFRAPYRIGHDVPGSVGVVLDGFGDATYDIGATPSVGSTVHAIWWTGTGESMQQGTLSVSISGTVVTVTGGPPGANASISWVTGLQRNSVRIRPYLGSSAQNIGADLVSEYPGEITSTDAAAGVAMAVIDFVFNLDAFPQGRPTPTAVIRGAKCYDPRKDSTVSGGSGSHRFATPSTWEWSENPAICALRYATWEYGWAVPIANVNLQDVITAANACDVSTVFTMRRPDSSTYTVTLPRYRCGIVIKSDGDHEQQMASIMQTMAGRVAWSGGTLRMRAGVMNSSVFAMDQTWLYNDSDDDDEPVIAGLQSISRSQRINRVTGSCVDQDQRYQMLPFPAVEDSTLIAAKGERLLEMPMEGVNHIAHAQHLASVAIRETQASSRYAAKCGYEALRLEVLDRGTLSLARQSIVNKPVEVLGWSWQRPNTIAIEMGEISDAIFTPLSELTGRDPAPDSNLRPPWEVEDLKGLTVTSGPSALLDGSIVTRTVVSWDAAIGENIRQGGEVQIQYADASLPLPDGDWPAAPPEAGTATQTVITGQLSGRHYLYRGRFVQKMPLVPGAWCDIVLDQNATRPQVPTDGIAHDAATDAYTDETSADSVTIPGTGGTSFKTCASRTYTNTSGRVAIVQFDAEVVGLRFGSIATLSAPDDFAAATWVFEVNGTPVQDDSFIDTTNDAMPPDPATRKSRQVGWQRTLNAGDTAKIYISVGGGTDSNAATISWDRTRLRTTVIKA